MGLSFNKNTDFKLTTYSDWSGCADTRRSTGGFSTFLGSNLISWSSKKHLTISKSSIEAKYRSLSEATSEITWLWLILKEIGIPLPSTLVLLCDKLIISSGNAHCEPFLSLEDKAFCAWSSLRLQKDSFWYLWSTSHLQQIPYCWYLHRKVLLKSFFIFTMKTQCATFLTPSLKEAIRVGRNPFGGPKVLTPTTKFQWSPSVL